MQKLSELIGKPIVSAESGERIGKVSDVLLDPHARHVLRIVVGGGILAAEHVLPYTDVQTLGKSIVIARTDSGVVSPSEWHKQAVDAIRSTTLRGRHVLTTNGRALGDVQDVLFDDAGKVEGFEITGGGVMQKRSILPHSSGVTVGPDAVLVPDEEAAGVQE